MTTPKDTKLTIICICGGIGFPMGLANTYRVGCIGKAIVEGGSRFVVWQYGSSPNNLNTQRKGVWNGIEFEYLCGRVSRPANKFLQLLFNVFGIIHLFFRLIFSVAGRKNTYVFIDLQKINVNILLTPFCRLLGIKIVQEVNEWWPDVESSSSLVHFQYKKIMFRFSNGSFIISKSYRDKVMQTAEVSRRHQFYYLPVLSEPVPVLTNGFHHQQPYLFWCGDVIGYMKDILFMVEAFSIVRKKFPDLRLVISGKYKEENKETLFAELTRRGVPLSSFSLTGFVDDNQLQDYVQHAAAVLAPMWNDGKSNTRFPTKLGLYSYAGKSIITAPVGELKDYFVDGQNCLFYEAGSETSLAQKITEVLSDDEKAERLGKNARLLAEQTFSYKNYVHSMQEFFMNL
jgi:glycosyltransferase involved in cell wall biosynthesis